MSDTLESLRHHIDGATKLNAVVHSLKAVAASAISQFERVVISLADYYRTVELALVAAFREDGLDKVDQSDQQEVAVGAIVFGSDQGLVGQFNERLADFVCQSLRPLPATQTVWVVGERMRNRLIDRGAHCSHLFAAPNSVAAIVPLIGEILTEVESERESGRPMQIYLFHNRPLGDGSSEPTSQRIWPIDQKWFQDLSQQHWPNRTLPELLAGFQETIPGLLREYLFVSLFKACAESLASENASLLAAMRRAEKNIDELLGDLQQSFHRLRQSSIDAELFDLVSGFEALPHDGHHR